MPSPAAPTESPAAPGRLAGSFLLTCRSCLQGPTRGCAWGGAQLLLAGEHLDDVTKEEGQRQTFPLVLVKEMLLVRVRYFVFPP